MRRDSGGVGNLSLDQGACNPQQDRTRTEGHDTDHADFTD